MEVAKFLISSILPKLTGGKRKGGPDQDGSSWTTWLLIVILCAAAYFAYTHYYTNKSINKSIPNIFEHKERPDDGLVSLLRNNVHIGSEDCPDRHDIRGTYVGKFISCYDGDTCDVVLVVPKDHGNTHGDPSKGMRLIRYRTRTMGYNAPEIRQPKDEDNREDKKKLAVVSRDILWSILSGGTGKQDHDNLMAVSCHGFDKYGRLLVQIWPIQYNEQAKSWYYDSAKESINQYMLRILGPEYAMDDKGRMVNSLGVDKGAKNTTSLNPKAPVTPVTPVTKKGTI